ncbi:MAG: 2OG-Fe(II) oxygenase [Methylophilaceae bacterium]|nr:2OG-Fe(II) oxygenase [Methylophilaceae bacterium]
MKYQRRLNLIIYLEESYKDKYGGHLGFWSHDKKNYLPKNLIKEIYPKFNRAVIFDTSQNSWHGLSTIVKVPKNKLRKSIAIYYLSKPKKITYLIVVHYMLYEKIKKNQKNLLILFELEQMKNHLIKCINALSFFLFACTLNYIAQENPLMQVSTMKDWFYLLCIV